jgi:hypothetical protein
MPAAAVSTSATPSSGLTVNYVTGDATISFTATDDRSGVTFTSERSGQSNPTLDETGLGGPAVGHQRNGVFF